MHLLHERSDGPGRPTFTHTDTIVLKDSDEDGTRTQVSLSQTLEYGAQSFDGMPHKKRR